MHVSATSPLLGFAVDTQHVHVITLQQMPHSFAPVIKYSDTELQYTYFSCLAYSTR